MVAQQRPAIQGPREMNGEVPAAVGDFNEDRRSR